MHRRCRQNPQTLARWLPRGKLRNCRWRWLAAARATCAPQRRSCSLPRALRGRVPPTVLVEHFRQNLQADKTSAMRSFWMAQAPRGQIAVQRLTKPPHRSRPWKSSKSPPPPCPPILAAPPAESRALPPSPAPIPSMAAPSISFGTTI